MAPKPANHMSLEAVLCKGSLLEALACAVLDAGFDVGFDVGLDVGFDVGFDVGLVPVLLDALVAMKTPYFWGGFGKTSL